ncbi:butyrophilin subfamily 1 member A1-like [Neolamprologus brichardi]|nr:butyrophilin subfamily 1 member A1-like [Neolamprologus brichardi]XP_006807433.1 butyrophilin subfamily 1 member A1-like [Neolamprologus brichardi]
MELLALLFLSFCFLTLSGLTYGAESGTPMVVKEDDDAILPCFFDTNVENIELMKFDWKKEGTDPRKQVFMYDRGAHHNNGLSDQDDQFKGRVSHFPEKLMDGNASIRINNTRLKDKGNYTCFFPNSKKTFLVELVVGAADPSVTILGHTNNGAQLKCDVKGAYPKPTVEWQDSKNQIIPSEDQTLKRGEDFYVTLKATVRKTDYYRCVATQKEIHHRSHTKIYVYMNGARSGTGKITATVLSVMIGIFATV